ncbi:MAG: carbamate kinase [Geobacter sp.]|nr:carbamate kinase [Geobacter sp.]
MGSDTGKPLLLVALGGNALIRKGETGTIAEQFVNLRIPARQLARLSRDYRIIITHGNGPQVGNLLLQQESCDTVPKLPLEILVAQTQGQIGYMVEATLDEELEALGLGDQLLVSLISYVVVDAGDPAFHEPTKPIGPFYTEEEAAQLPWPLVHTPNGYRRVVASPRPLTIVEKREIRKLVNDGFIVICCGGGGIPVTREGRAFHGIDAVIDKDLASARLACEVGVDILLIATDVPGVANDFGKLGERYLSNFSIADAEHALARGDLPPGSMRPKVEAAVQFVRSGGSRAVICHLNDIGSAVKGEAGTEITA